MSVHDADIALLHLSLHIENPRSIKPLSAFLHNHSSNLDCVPYLGSTLAMPLCKICGDLDDDFHQHTPFGDLCQSAALGCSSCALLRDGISEIIGAKLGISSIDNCSFTYSTIPGVTPDGTLPLHVEVKLDCYTIDLEFYSLKSAPCKWSSIGPAPHIFSFSGSEQYLDLARSWYQSCVTYDSDCGGGLVPTLPSRVIAVGSDDEAPKLYASKGERAQYAVLSHCWGNHQPLTTTQSTLNDRTTAIPLEIIPRTFQDAIIISRRLLIKYLWIDSLCIIQDSPSDWEVESSRMSLIYKDAALMISVDNSPDSRAGCFVTSLDRNISPVTIECEGLGGKRSLAFVRPRGERSDVISHVAGQPENWQLGRFVGHRFKQGSDYFLPVSPAPKTLHGREVLPATSRKSLLSLRGWTLQERLLARRILHCTGTELAWECRTYMRCECQERPEITRYNKSGSDGLYSNDRFLASNNDTEGKSLYLGRPEYALLNGPSKHYVLQWTNLVEEFTHRRLTFETDRLAALSGLAAIHSAANGDQYLFGLWKSTLAGDLLWEQGSRDRFESYEKVGGGRQAPEFAPSWSWASITGPVIWPLKDGSSQNVSISNKDDGSYGTAGFAITILEVVCRPRGKDPFGDGTGSILLSGYCIPGTLQWLENDSEMEELFFKPHTDLSLLTTIYGSVLDEEELLDDNFFGLLTVKLDDDLEVATEIDHEIVHRKDYICLYIHMRGFTGQFYSLLLQKLSYGQNIYRRVGLAWKDNGLLMSWEQHYSIETVTII